MDSPVTMTPDLVIKELWPTETRTKRSADVATEMNRLRHALKSYYETEGTSDPIAICLPNRAPSAGDGTHDRAWIVAKPHPDKGDPELPNRTPGSPEKPRRTWNLAAVIVALTIVLGAVGYISFRALALPAQPRSGRLEGSTLVVFDAEGKELWRKVFSDGFGPDWYYHQNYWGGPYIWFADLEGKGHTSVLFSYSPAAPEWRSSTLICYSDRGEEKWRWTPGKEMPELRGPATFKITALAVLQAIGNSPRRIVVSSQHSPWWANQIALLGPDGKTVSEYWHSGGLNWMTLADLDGDGREEIIATGVANGYDHQATLVVLEPDHVSGASTEVRPEFQIHDMGVAQERLRLLFTRSDLNRALYQFNMAMDPVFVHGSLRLTVGECITPLPPGCRIWYEFDKDFHLIAAFAGADEFRSAHNRFYQTGKNAHTLSEEEQDTFQKVRCLVGCKSEFVPVGKLVP